MASLLMLLSYYSTDVAAFSCSNASERPLEFRFFTDSRSWQDNGWTLECRDSDDSSPKLLWEAPIGSLKYQGSTEVVLEEACIPDSATCTMRIFDASGDGLQGGTTNGNSFTGWFALLHGATTIGTYQNLEDPAFSELTYCVGPNCDQKPQELQTNDEDCQDIIYLALQLDNRPQDTTYQLICGGNNEVVWDGKGFSKAGAFVEEETCLPKNVCCEFVITDGDTNGLTSDVDVADSSLADGTKPQGYIFLERNYEPLLEYNGATGEEFAILTKTFGSCSADKTSIRDQQEDSPTSTYIDNVEEIQEYLKDLYNRDPSQSSGFGDEDEDLDDFVVPDLVEDENVDGFDINDSLEDDFVNDDAEEKPDTASTGSDLDVEKVSEYVNEYLEENEQDNDLDREFTIPPSSFGDHDNENFNINENDDGAGFGLWDDNYGDDDGAFTDDVEEFNTEKPTTFGTETVFPTEMPSTERQPGDLYDDVVEDDDVQWTKDELQHLEDLAAAADNSISKHPSDTWTNDYSKQQGMQKGSKIATGILVPLLILATIGLALYMAREKLKQRFGARFDDEALEKGTTASRQDVSSSGSSYEQDDLGSHNSLKEVTV